jgi:hypothetical protein
MGTGVEQPPGNDNEVQWRLSAPDAAGDVWLEWTTPDAGEPLNLGAKEFVQAAFVEWLVSVQP